MTKLFTGKIPVAKPWFSDQEEKLVLEAIRSGWVAQGPMVKAFEKEVAQFIGVPHAIAANSCTSALQIALEVLGVGPGDEVIVPSFTFIATANCVIDRGAVPVFADIDPSTYNIDPADLEKKISPRTKCVIPVDQVGLPADIDAIRAIAKRRGLAVLEDAACALGSEYKGKRIGGLNDITCFSFHPRKVITAGEGGMILTADAAYAEKARSLVSHGASVSDLVRHQSSKVVIEEYRNFGYNYRMSDLQAAVGLGQFRRLEEILTKKRFFAERYTEAFSGIAEVVPPVDTADYRTNYQSYMIRLTDRAARSRDEIMDLLLEKGISTRRGIMAIHLEPAFLKRFGKCQLPETEKALRETMILPLYPQMTLEEQDYVIQTLTDYLRA